MSEKYSNIFLERWINNSLSPKELKEFKESSEFAIYQKILDKSAELEAPKFNKEEVFAKIKDKIGAKKKGKIRSLSFAWVYTTAASVAILFGVFYFWNNASYKTGFGEQLAVVLPDNSEVLLNSNSKLQFAKLGWGKSRRKRELKLEGEAYFKVEKGLKFEVKTNEGLVTVLGTEFNVKTDVNYFEVSCFEGKVQVNRNNYEAILTKGMTVRQIEENTLEKWNFSEAKPSWSLGESSFNNTPLKYVIKAIENQFKIKINASKINSDKKFTGSFNHTDIEIAFQTVFVPMKIGVTFVNEKTVLLVKQ